MRNCKKVTDILAIIDPFWLGPDILSPASVDAQRCQETKALNRVVEATKFQRFFFCRPTILPCTCITCITCNHHYHYHDQTENWKKRKTIIHEIFFAGHPHTFASTRSSCRASMLWCQLQHQGTAPWQPKTSPCWTPFGTPWDTPTLVPTQQLDCLVSKPSADWNTEIPLFMPCMIRIM